VHRDGEDSVVCRNAKAVSCDEGEGIGRHKKILLRIECFGCRSGQPGVQKLPRCSKALSVGFETGYQSPLCDLPAVAYAPDAEHCREDLIDFDTSVC
jgi:hypothetical protein